MSDWDDTMMSNVEIAEARAAVWRRHRKVWHRHGRPVINVDTPPHVHAHVNGDKVEHSHHGLGNVVAIGRSWAASAEKGGTETPE